MAGCVVYYYMAFQESLLTDAQLAKKEAELSTITDANESRWEENRSQSIMDEWRNEDSFGEMLDENEGFDGDWD